MKKASKKRTHPYKHYLNELRPLWRKDSEKFKTLAKEIVERKSRSILFRGDYMRFLDLFLVIHKKELIKVDENYYLQMAKWAREQLIQYHAEVYTRIKNYDYSLRYWATDEIELQYIEKQIKIRARYLDVKWSKGKIHRDKVQILRSLRNGELPGFRSLEPEMIGLIVGMLQYIEILKKKRQVLLSKKYKSTVKVPIELKKDDMTNDYAFHVQVPAGFIQSLTDQKIKAEGKTEPPEGGFQDLLAAKLKLLTRKEAAKVLQVSLPTLDELTKNGTLKCVRIGDTNMKRYRFEDIEAALVKMKVDPQL